MNNLFENGKYYTITDIALRLKVNPLTVRRWIKAGQLKADRIGKLIRISGDVMNDHIKSY